MTQRVQRIYHITPRADWETGRKAGVYTAGSLETEGFIHCSTAAQVLDTAERYYRTQASLVLLEIDTKGLTAPLRFEDSYGHGDRFPHLYGPLNLDAVVRVLRFEPDPKTGRFAWPDERFQDERS